jgi:hypothetical protein
MVSVMQNLGGYINQIYQRTVTLYSHIELNPARARMVEHSAVYPWSSYRSNAVIEISDYSHHILCI